MQSRRLYSQLLLLQRRHRWFVFLLLLFRLLLLLLAHLLLQLLLQPQLLLRDPLELESSLPLGVLRTRSLRLKQPAAESTSALIAELHLFTPQSLQHNQDR